MCTSCCGDEDKPHYSPRTRPDAFVLAQANITLLQTILGLVARLNAKFCNSLLNALVAAKINVGRLGIKLAI